MSKAQTKPGSGLPPRIPYQPRAPSSRNLRKPKQAKGKMKRMGPIDYDKLRRPISAQAALERGPFSSEENLCQQVLEFRRRNLFESHATRLRKGDPRDLDPADTRTSDLVDLFHGRHGRRASSAQARNRSRDEPASQGTSMAGASRPHSSSGMNTRLLGNMSENSTKEAEEWMDQMWLAKRTRALKEKKLDEELENALRQWSINRGRMDDEIARRQEERSSTWRPMSAPSSQGSRVGAIFPQTCGPVDTAQALKRKQVTHPIVAQSANPAVHLQRDVQVSTTLANSSTRSMKGTLSNNDPQHENGNLTPTGGGTRSRTNSARSLDIRERKLKSFHHASMGSSIELEAELNRRLWRDRKVIPLPVGQPDLKYLGTVAQEFESPTNNHGNQVSAKTTSAPSAEEKSESSFRGSEKQGDTMAVESPQAEPSDTPAQAKLAGTTLSPVAVGQQPAALTHGRRVRPSSAPIWGRLGAAPVQCSNGRSETRWQMSRTREEQLEECRRIQERFVAKGLTTLPLDVLEKGLVVPEDRPSALCVTNLPTPGSELPTHPLFGNLRSQAVSLSKKKSKKKGKSKKKKKSK